MGRLPLRHARPLAEEATTWSPSPVLETRKATGQAPDARETLPRLAPSLTFNEACFEFAGVLLGAFRMIMRLLATQF